MKRIRIFISSVQSEFTEERAMLCHYIRTDALLGKFFEPFIFEEVPANELPASHVYLKEVELCDIYLGLYGNLYGYEDETGTEDIINKCRDYGLKTPEFHQEEDFKVIIWRAAESQDVPKAIQDDPKAIQDVPKAIQDVPKELANLVNLIKKNPSISRAELARQLNLSERQVRKIMDQLRAEDRLIRRGGKTGQWIITDKQ